MDASIREIRSLLEYLIKHNRDHATEILELAERTQSLGNARAYEHILKGVDMLNDSNTSLQAALDELEV